MPAEQQKKHVISVYVDVGECTDAIQHKGRGDVQASGILGLHLCRI